MDSSPITMASDKPWMKLGSVSELVARGERVSPANRGALVSGIAVHLGHLPLLGQVVLEWGVVHVRRSVQNKINRFLI